MLILTAVPFVSVVYTVESWPWGTRMCVVSEFMKDFSTGVSVFTLVAMSLDRFVAIVNPLRRFQGTGKFNSIYSLLPFIQRVQFVCFILISSICRWFALNSHFDPCGKLYGIQNLQLWLGKDRWKIHWISKFGLALAKRCAELKPKAKHSVDINI